MVSSFRSEPPGEISSVKSATLSLSESLVLPASRNSEGDSPHNGASCSTCEHGEAECRIRARDEGRNGVRTRAGEEFKDTGFNRAGESSKGHEHTGDSRWLVEPEVKGGRPLA